MTAGLHDRVTNARLVHAFYRSSGVDRKAKNGVSKKKVIRCGCTPVSVKISKIFWNLLFCHQKKVFAIGLHALVHILGTATNCCCTADVYRARLVYLYA